MSKYIRNYDSRSAYEVDTARPKDKSVVSKTGNDVKYNPVNVILPYESCLLQFGDIPLYDKIDKCRKILKASTVDSMSNIDTSRFVVADAMYVDSELGLDYFVYKKPIGTLKNSYSGANDEAEQWAANCQYKLTLDLTANGGFNYSYTQNGSAVTGSVSWSAGDSIESVIAAINKNTFTKVDANNIEVSWYSYSGDTLTLLNDTGVTLLDCSLSARIGANGTPFNQHKGFQTTAVKTLFPELDFMSANSSCYCKSGNNSSYLTCCNLDKFEMYYTTNGAATFTAESSVTPMKKTTFEACGQSQVAAEKEVYDKYNGSYREYCASRMLDMRSTRGLYGVSFGMAKRFTKALSSVFYTNAKGETKNAYPAAAICNNFGITTEGHTTGFEAGNWCLASPSLLYKTKTVEGMSKLNSIVTKLSGYMLFALAAAWCVGEYRATNGWSFNSNSGTLTSHYKFHSFRVRPFLALPSI